MGEANRRGSFEKRKYNSEEHQMEIFQRDLKLASARAKRLVEEHNNEQPETFPVNKTLLSATCLHYMENWGAVLELNKP